MNIKQSNIVNILIFTVLFFSLMNHYASVIIQKIEFSSSYGYIEYQECYSISSDLITEFDSDQELINWLKENLTSFTLVKKSGITYGIYVYNDKWLMPLLNGNLFSDEQNESTEVFYISNNDLVGVKIGTPLPKEKYNFVNLLSLDSSFSKYSNISLSEYYINQKVTNENKSDYFYKVNFTEYSISILYNILYIILFLICLLHMFITNYNDHRIEISIRKLCGFDDIEIIIKMMTSLIFQLVLASIIGITAFLLFNPEIVVMEAFRSELYIYIFYTLKMILPLYLICGITVTITVFKATPLGLLRSME